MLSPMATVQITFDVPAAAAGPDAAARARQLLLLDAVRCSRMDWRAAARELDLSLSAFLDLAREHHVPVVKYALDDWQGDQAALQKLLTEPDSVT
jgi:hypothetical protein